MKQRIAFYGGTFDPVHCGHIAVARNLVRLFSLDEFYFLPAFHAPHKPGTKPTSAFHRFAMLNLATRGEARLKVSALELEHACPRYTVETIPELSAAFQNARIFFVMGADSWNDIRTWREWERVLLMTSHIVVTRPRHELTFNHVTDKVREKIVDLRNGAAPDLKHFEGDRIYLTDAAWVDISATEIREDVRVDARLDREEDVPEEVAKYIQKYELYK